MTPEQMAELLELAQAMAADTDGDMESQVRDRKLTPEERAALRRDYIVALQDLWGME